MSEEFSSSSSSLPSWRLRKYGEHENKCAKFISYIVLAEFDIDTGSTVRHQYPSQIPNYKDDWLAEHMLPEGAHNRDMDHSFIFLNRNGKHLNELKFDQEEDNKHTITIKTPSSRDGDIFLYGINLCQTKFDSNVRRGAIVKSMALFSPYNFVDTLKRPLEIALSLYFENPVIDILADFFESLNSIDISQIPSPTNFEIMMMSHSSMFDFDKLGCTYVKDYSSSTWKYNLNLNFSHSNINKIDSVDENCSQPRENGVMDNNNGDLPYVISLDNVIIEDKPESSDSHRNYSSTISLSLSLAKSNDEIGDSNLIDLCNILGESTMRIYNAVLMKKRIIFVGYNHAAEEIGKMVLAAASLVSPVITDIIKRVYPYSHLSDLNFLEIPGYLAGVTNPMFLENESWWDMACILDFHGPGNKTIQIRTCEDKDKRNMGGLFGGLGLGSDGDLLSLNANNKELKEGGGGIVGLTSKIVTVTATTLVGGNEDDLSVMALDKQFITTVLSGIYILTSQSHDRCNIEDWVKCQFKEYTMSIITATHIYYENHNINHQTIPDVSLSPSNFVGSYDNNVLANNMFLQLNESSFSYKYKKFYDSNIQRSLLLQDIDQIKVAYTFPWIYSSSHHSELIQKYVQTNEELINQMKEDILNNGDESPVSPYGPHCNYRNSSSIYNVYIHQKRNLLRLQIETQIDPYDLASITGEIYDTLHDESCVQSLVIFMLESYGGLNPILSGLFSVNPQVRLHVVNIIDRLSSYESSKPQIQYMNSSLIAAYNRQFKLSKDGSLEESIKRYYEPKNPNRLTVQPGITNTKEKGERSRTSTLYQDFNSYIDATFDLLA